MFGFGKSAAEKEMKKLLYEIQINLENNYKDLAIAARQQAQERLDELHDSGELIGKPYERLKKQLEGYTERMIGYHH